MTTKPYTWTQANAICRDYQYLCGLLMDRHMIGKGYIECVAVSPYETARKWMFAQFYRESRDPVKALQFYKGTEYDVIALSIPLLRKRGIFFIDLLTYTSEQQIPFDRHLYENTGTGGGTKYPFTGT